MNINKHDLSPLQNVNELESTFNDTRQNIKDVIKKR
jgi:hypothetical protein